MIKSETNSFVFGAAIFLFSFLAFNTCQAALVPCGGPGQHACTICDLFTLTQTTLKYAVFVLVPALIAFWLVAAGMYYLGSQGDAKKLATAGKLIKATGFGTVILFTGWVFVNTFFAFLGIAEWNGLKLNESWWKISAKCGAMELAAESCGDGIVQDGEECEPNMSVADCQARSGFSVNECEKMISRCSPDCTLVAAGDEEITDDENSGGDNENLFDYCALPIYQRDLKKANAEAVKATKIMPEKGVNCLDACKKIKKTCFGVGSYDELNCSFLYVVPPCCWQDLLCKNDNNEPLPPCKPSYEAEAVADCEYSSLDLFPKNCKNKDFTIFSLGNRCEAATIMKAEIDAETYLANTCADEGEYKAVEKNCSKVHQVRSGSAFCYCR